MLGLTSLLDEKSSLPCQVETDDEAAWSKDAASGRITRSLWMGLGCATLMLTVAACVLVFPCSHASANPASPGPEFASYRFVPMSPLPQVQGIQRQPLPIPTMNVEATKKSSLSIGEKGAVDGLAALPDFGQVTQGFGSHRTSNQEHYAEDAHREYERYLAAVKLPLSNIDESAAQLTQAIRIRGLLSQEDIDEVHRAAAAVAQLHADSTIDRSAWGQPKRTWLVTFLNTAGEFQSRLPHIHARVREAALAVDREHWNIATDLEHVSYRAAEYHTMLATLNGKPTGGGLHTKHHCDHGSLVTIDILLSDPAEFEGGVLQTLEADGELHSHPWQQGDALVFLSHKYHSVSTLTRGKRNVLVCELWQGTENHKPSRDEKERWVGEWKDEEWRRQAPSTHK